MKSIHYAGEELVTGDALADAIVQYAEALAQHETSASIDAPVVTESGDVVQASFLLGPASQIVAVPVKSSFPDPIDLEIVERILAARAKLNGLPVLPTEDREEDRYDYGL